MYKPSENSDALTSQKGKDERQYHAQRRQFHPQNGITVHTHKHGWRERWQRFDRRPAVTTCYTGNEPGRNGKPERYGAPETVSQGHPDHPAGQPGYATGNMGSLCA